jgi:hypothetical protein
MTVNRRTFESQYGFCECFGVDLLVQHVTGEM